MIKAIARFVTTAALCLLFYSLGQLPGAPSPRELYQKARGAAESLQQSGAEGFAAEMMRSGREAVASVVGQVPAVDLQTEQSQPPAARPVAVQGGIPRCW